MRTIGWRPACSWWPAFADLIHFEEVQAFIAVIGTITLYFRRLDRPHQMDLKKGLAYSNGVPAGLHGLSDAACGAPVRRDVPPRDPRFFKGHVVPLVQGS